MENVAPSRLFLEGGGGFDLLYVQVLNAIEASTHADLDFTETSIFETVALHREAALDIESVLNASARYLEGWGFRPPVLNPRVELPGGDIAYRVYLVENIQADSGHNFAGKYGGCHYNVILLSAEEILENGQLTDYGAQTVAHELFHAVQFGAPFFDCELDGSPGSWITEGTARAVGWDLARLVWDDTPEADGEHQWGRRSYEEPLPVAYDWPPPRIAYATGSFWRYLSEAAAIGAPGPEVNPVDYSFLARMFDHPAASRDCMDGYSSCQWEVRWLDTQLRTLFASSLREKFALFLQTYIQYDGNRPRIDTREWDRSSFENCELVVFRKTDEPDLGEAANVVHIRREHFNRHAGVCFLVTPRGYGNDVRVRVRVFDPRGDLAIEDLTAGVEGRPFVGQSAQVEIADAEMGQRTAAWTFDFVANETTKFFLTNMADNAETTQFLDGLQVRFTVIEEYARLGTSTSSGTGDLAELFGALPIELDQIRSHNLIPVTTEAQMAAGLSDDVCALRFVATNSQTGDGLEIAFDHQGPIAPGDHSVAYLEDGQFSPPEEHPNAAVVMVRIGEGNATSQGFEQVYGGQSGYLTFDVVSPDRISGSLLAEVRRYIDGAYIDDLWTEFPAETEALSVTAEFSFVPELPAGSQSLLSMAGCFDPVPVAQITGGDSGTGSAADTSNTDDEQGEEDDSETDETEEADTDSPGIRPDAVDTVASADDETTATIPEADSQPASAPTEDASMLPVECRPLVFESTTPFDPPAAFPFGFSHPEGWVHVSEATAPHFRGAIAPPDYPGGGIRYSVRQLERESDIQLAQTMASIWDEIGTITLAGTEIPVRGGVVADTLNLRLVIPANDMVLDVEMLFLGRTGCDIALAQRIQEAFLQSVISRR